MSPGAPRPPQRPRPRFQPAAILGGALPSLPRAAAAALGGLTSVLQPGREAWPRPLHLHITVYIRRGHAPSLRRRADVTRCSHYGGRGGSSAPPPSFSIRLHPPPSAAGAACDGRGKGEGAARCRDSPRMAFGDGGRAGMGSCGLLPPVRPTRPPPASRPAWRALPWSRPFLQRLPEQPWGGLRPPLVPLRGRL